MKKTLYKAMPYLLGIIASTFFSNLWATTNFEAGIITLLTFIFIAIVNLRN